jgi:hypothetical protein
MFSSCLFCHGALGANDTIEHFPVGKRLAFDGERGRLWAVCPRCARWNLAPIEERWEALEECEKAYRTATKRVSTDNIALARLKDGTDLVRIGQPLLPEYAAWRYGDMVRNRRRRFFNEQTGTLFLSAVGAGVLGTGVATGATSALLSPILTPILFASGGRGLVEPPSCAASLRGRASRQRCGLAASCGAAPQRSAPAGGRWRVGHRDIRERLVVVAATRTRRRWRRSAHGLGGAGRRCHRCSRR